MTLQRPGRAASGAGGWAGRVCAQELEPRRWSHLPTGLNVVGSSLVVMDGNIFFDPVMQIEDGHRLNLSGGFSYGGESRVNGAFLDNSERTRFYSIGWLTRQQSVRIAYVNADTNVVISTRSDSLLLSWSLAWGLKRPGTTPGRPHVCGIPIAG